MSLSRRSGSFALMVLLLAASIAAALADEGAATGTQITGTVMQSGQPVPGATVIARDLSSGEVSRSLPTNASGRYVIHTKGIGYHDMAVEAGNKIFPATRVLNVIGEATTANFQLLPSVDPSGQPRTFEGVDGETAGSADLTTKGGGGNKIGRRSMKSKKVLGGVAAIVGGVAVGQLLSDDSSPSPTTP